MPDEPEQPRDAVPVPRDAPEVRVAVRQRGPLPDAVPGLRLRREPEQQAGRVDGAAHHLQQRVLRQAEQDGAEVLRQERVRVYGP